MCWECISTQEGAKKMTKKEYFLKNVPCASLNISAFAAYVLYGVEYDINDYAYIAYVVDNKIQSCHKLMIYNTKDGSTYVNVHGSRLHISEFCRL